jgi:flagellar export protein FliJ
MRDALTVLKRIRKHRKQGAEHSFMEAERAREVQQERVEALESEVAASREGEATSDEACWVAQAAAWRMKMEVRLRTERGRLAERTDVSNACRQDLTQASREHRVVERIIEINDERRRLEERRREDKKLDAMGTRRWKRKGVS